MIVSKRGLAEIASHEGIVTSRYRDSVGVFTIGIGHTKSAGSPDPQYVNSELSIAEVMTIFARDIAKFEERVNRAFTRNLTQAQFDAAVSFDFNTGGIHRATWVRHFNAGRDAEARKAFMNWSKPKEIIPRRRAERDLFFSGKYSGNGYATVYPAINGRVIWSRGKRVNVLELIDKKPATKPAQKPAQKKMPSAGAATAGAGAIAALAALWAKWGDFTSWLGGLFQ